MKRLSKVVWPTTLVILVLFACNKKEEPFPQKGSSSQYEGVWLHMYSYVYSGGRFDYSGCPEKYEFSGSSLYVTECDASGGPVDTFGPSEWEEVGNDSIWIFDWAPSQTLHVRYNQDTLIFYDPIEGQDFGFIKQ